MPSNTAIGSLIASNVCSHSCLPRRTDVVQPRVLHGDDDLAGDDPEQALVGAIEPARARGADAEDADQVVAGEHRHADAAAQRGSARPSRAPGCVRSSMTTAVRVAMTCSPGHDVDQRQN